MNNIKKLLVELISISNNTHRTKLYQGFYDTLILKNISENNKDTLNVMYANFSGLIAHSELDKNEYDVLKLLLQQLNENNKL